MGLYTYLWYLRYCWQYVLFHYYEQEICYRTLCFKGPICLAGKSTVTGRRDIERLSEGEIKKYLSIFMLPDIMLPRADMPGRKIHRYRHDLIQLREIQRDQVRERLKRISQTLCYLTSCFLGPICLAGKSTVAGNIASSLFVDTNRTPRGNKYLEKKYYLK